MSKENEELIAACERAVVGLSEIEERVNGLGRKLSYIALIAGILAGGGYRHDVWWAFWMGVCLTALLAEIALRRLGL